MRIDDNHDVNKAYILNKAKTFLTNHRYTFQFLDVRVLEAA